MNYKTKMLRNRIIFVILTVVFLTGCGWLIGFGNMLKSILWLFVGIVCLVGGAFFIIARFGQSGRSSFPILAGWYGFSFAILTVLGMLFDPKSASFTWIYFLKIAGIVGLGTFLFIILTTPINMAALRFWRKNLGNPTDRRK